MTLQELLKQHGIADDVITALLADMKKNKVFTASEENLDIRYGKLKGDFDNLTAEHQKSTDLIAQLQKATKDNEGVQAKITQYEATIKDLQDKAKKAEVDSILKIGLLSAGAKAGDIDYLLYKMEHDGEWTAELGEDGKIKGLDDKIKGLKTQYPNQFDTTAGGKKEKILDPAPLPEGDKKKTVTKEEFMRMGYQARLDLKKSNPELYKTLTAH
jgi:hypothetical protein